MVQFIESELVLLKKEIDEMLDLMGITALRNKPSGCYQEDNSNDLCSGELLFLSRKC